MSALLRVRGTNVSEIYAGAARAAAFRRDVAFVSELGGNIIRVNLLTGARRVVARLPISVGHLTVSPSGDRVAGVQTQGPTVNAPMPPPDRLVLIRLVGRTPLVASVSLGSRYFSGELRWLSDVRLAVLNAGQVRTFGPTLRQAGRLQSWRATNTVVASGVLYGLARSSPFGPTALEAAKLPSESGRRLRELPGAPMTLATVPGAISLRAARRPICLLLGG
jgi:hypothetical protein